MSSNNIFILRIYLMIVVIASISLPSISIVLFDEETSNEDVSRNERNQEQYDIISIKNLHNGTYSRNEKVIQRELRQKKDRPFDPNSTTIRNDVKWLDDRGLQLDTTRGGEISKIDGVFYWVGTRPYTHKDEGNGDIYLYKSNTLGSNSWTFVRKLYNSPGKMTGASCQLNKNTKYQTFMIHCKGGQIYTSDSLDKDFQKLPKPTVFEEQKNIYKWGDTTFFHDKSSGENAFYMITTRAKRIEKNDENKFGIDGESRTVFIYRFNDKWSTLWRNPVVSWKWQNREGFSLVYSNGFYFLSASMTAGWRDSKTYYRKSSTLKGLSSVEDKEMKFFPGNEFMINSGGSQHRQIFKAGKGKWFFLGSRHPSEDPSEYHKKYGRAIILPLKFKKGEPEVYWKYDYDINLYNFHLRDYDEHFHGGIGHTNINCSKLPNKSHCKRAKYFCIWDAQNSECKRKKKYQ